MAHEIVIDKIATPSGRIFPLKSQDAETLMTMYDSILKGTTTFEQYVKQYSLFAAVYEAAMPVSTDPAAVPTGPVCYLCKVHLCAECGKCEQESCKLYGYTVIEAKDLAPYRHLLAATQKARGYVALAEAKGSAINVPKPYAVVMEESDIDGMDKALLGQGQIFVRPCPVRPRHGFVESRSVVGNGNKSVLADIKAILKEARKEDDHAELLICPYAPASFNAVITPTRLAFGAGHDGATAGRGAVTVPLIATRPAEITDEILIKAGVGKAEDPYIEAVTGNNVTGNGNVQITQLRAGEKLTADIGDDYIPHPIKVRRVIAASGDLLEWERQVKQLELDGFDGVVVTHVGGTLISHYGVHCLTHHIPIMTSRVPAIGEVLTPMGRVVEPDPAAVLRGIGIGTLIPLAPDDQAYRCRAAVCMLLTTMHNAPAMGGHYGVHLGVASVMMHKLGMSASHGEARHARGSGRLGRSQVYTEALKHTFRARRMLGITYRLFLQHKWSSGYGGPKWGDCTNSVVRLDKAIRAVVQDPSPSNVTELTASLNNAVNQAHNGGWWLNKYVQTSYFDLAMKQSLTTLVGGAPIFVEAGIIDRDTKQSDAVLAAIAEWRTQDDILIPDSVLSEDSVGKVPIEVDDPNLFIKKGTATKKVEAVKDVATPGTVTPFIDYVAIKKAAEAAKVAAKAMKAAATITVVKPTSPTISAAVEAQGWYTLSSGQPILHVQHRKVGSSYNSFNHPVDKPASTFKSWLADYNAKHVTANDFKQSWGSENRKYVPVTAVPNTNGKVTFTEPELGLTFEQVI